MHNEPELMRDINSSLGFSDLWFSLGLLDVSEARALMIELRKGEDPHPEHYRWRVFTNYLKRQPVLPESVVRQLYDLAKTEPDRLMGESMVAAILKRSECPLEIIKTASKSDRPHIHKIANARLNVQR